MKRIRFIVIVVVVIMLGALAFGIFRAREPRYEGRTLTDWIETGIYIHADRGENPTYEDLYPETTADAQRSIHAIREIGSDAIPFLLRWAQAQDSPRRVAFNNWLFRHQLYRFHLPLDSEFRTRAWLGFMHLGDKSKPAWPALIQLTCSTNRVLRFSALRCLEASKPDKEMFVPVLLRLMKDPDRDVRGVAAEDLHFVSPELAEASGVYKIHPEFKGFPAPFPYTVHPPAK